MTLSSNRAFYLLLVLSMILLGCQRFHPLPLTASAVDRALTPPDAQTLKVQAQSLRHPILKPLVINERDGLSPDEAAVLAVLMNPSLRAERDQRAMSDAQVLQSGLLPNPSLDASLSIPTFGTTAGSINAWAVSGSWDLQGLIHHRALKAAAKEDRNSVYLDVAWKEWETAEAAKKAVYQLISLRQQVQLATSTDKRLAENLSVTRNAVNQGLLTELDLSAAQAASNEGHDKLIKLQQQAREQELNLRKALGLPPTATVVLDGTAALPGHIAPPSAEALLQGLDVRRLDLVALQRGYESQNDKIRAAILDQFPKITPSYGNERDTSNVGTSTYGMSMDVPLFDRNQGNIAIENATRQKLFDEYANRVFDARAEIAGLIEMIQALNEQIALARKAVPDLQKLVDTYEVAMKLGQVDVLSYYNARNSLEDKQIDIIALQQQLAESRIDLELASGWYDIEAAKTAAPLQPQRKDSSK